MASEAIEICEVVLTDGLIAAGTELSASTRTQIVELLADCGLRYVEVGALQANGDQPVDRSTFECAGRLAESAEVTYAGLMRDPASYALFRRTALDTISLRLHAHEHPTEKIAASWGVSNVLLALDRMEPWLPDVIADGYRVRVSIFDAFESIQSSSRGLRELIQCARGLIELGCFQVSFSDTCGTSTPREVSAVAAELIEALGRECVALQLGNALGRGLVNFYASWQAGVRWFDTTLNGIGCLRGQGGVTACLPTEDLVAFCRAEGIPTGVDLPRLVRTGKFTASQLDMEPLSPYSACCGEDGLPLHRDQRRS